MLRRLCATPPDAFAEKRHYHIVDFSRGIAALAVLLWHYQHFYFLLPGGEPSFAGRQVQPLYGLLAPFYEYGLYSVQFFWVISGFVFASVYGGDRPGTAAAYAVNRFSRLYPLHFVTLLVVAALQWLSYERLGHGQIYQHNDAFHFVLQLLFISHWGFQEGTSFNGPIWSVSIEVLVYAVFWLVLPYVFRRGVLGPSAMALGFLGLITLHVPGAFWACGMYFFIGSGTFVLLRTIGRERAPALLLAGGLIASFAVAFPFSSARLGTGKGIPATLVMPLLFSGTILLLGHLESSRIAPFFRRITWIGDNTYGVYLWHVPIQIAVLIVLDTHGIPRDIASSPLFLLSFLACVMVVGRLSFLFLERPAQRLLRNRLSPNPPVAHAPSPAIDSEKPASPP